MMMTKAGTKVFRASNEADDEVSFYTELAMDEIGLDAFSGDREAILALEVGQSHHVGGGAGVLFINTRIQ
jgi:hypothetical protein